MFALRVLHVPRPPPPNPRVKSTVLRLYSRDKTNGHFLPRSVINNAIRFSRIRMIDDRSYRTDKLVQFIDTYYYILMTTIFTSLFTDRDSELRICFEQRSLNL